MIKLSNILKNGYNGVQEFYGVELDTNSSDNASFIKRISFKAELDENGFVDVDFLYRLSIWCTNSFDWRIDTMVEIPSCSNSDLLSVLYGISAMDASVLIMPPLKGASEEDKLAFFKRLVDVGELSFTKSFQKPVQPISGYLAKLMAESYSGEDAFVDLYLNRIFATGDVYIDCQSEVIEVLNTLIKTHIGDEGSFRAFSKQMLDQVAIKIKGLLDHNRIMVE